jgi:sensor histidine kinase YesM
LNAKLQSLKLILSIVFVFVQLTCLAQIPFYYSFSEQTDFAPKSTYFLYEDTKRNIWFGTDEGLYVWDGDGFRNFQHPNYSNAYSSIEEDTTGRIWCQNFTGQVFYVENDSLKLFVDVQENVITRLDYTTAYFPQIYFSTDFGLLKYDFYTKTRNRVTIKPYRNVALKCLIEDKDTIYYDPVRGVKPFKDGLVFMNGADIYYLNLKSKEKIILKSYSKHFVNDPCFIPFQNKIYFIDNRLINKLKIPRLSYLNEKNEFENIAVNSKSELNVNSSLMDGKSQQFWFGSKNGVFILDSNYKNLFPTFLTSKNVSDIIKDKEGNYWIATLNNGVYIVPDLKILNYKNQKNIQDQQIVAVKKDRNNRINFVSEQGDVFQQNKNGIFNRIGTFNQNVEKIHYNPYRNEITAGNLREAFNLNKKEVVPNVFGRNVKSIAYLSEDIVVTSGSSNSSLRITSTNIELSNHLKELFNKPIVFEKNSNEKNISFIIRSKRSKHTVYDKVNNTLYISYADGLFYCKDKNEVEIKNDEKPLLVSFIKEATKGGLWCVTISGELLHIKETEINKIGNVKIAANEILEWGNFLFISTNVGLLKYNIKTKEQITIDELDGLPSNNILDIEIVDNSLYVATGKGVSKLSCNYNFSNQINPLVKFKRVAIWEKDTTITSSYNLSHQQNNFTFYFKALSTRSQHSFLFQYRMLGLDSNWITQKSENNIARFPSLPPGDYLFQVKAINEDGIKSNIEEIELFIDSPYYQKWWFYVAVGLLIVLLVSLIFIIRIKIIQKQNTILQDKKEVEKQLSKSQLSALRSQMNPHFVFNALNSIQEYIITNNKELASDYLGLFADLMRKYLHFSEEEEISLEEELETLEMYLKLEKIRFEETLIYKVNVDSELSLSEVKIPVMLVQPFVENAIKHGLLHKKGERKLTINFNKKNNNLIIDIIDNGVGRKQAAEINKMRNKSHKSYATSALQKRIMLLNKERKSPMHIQYLDLSEESKSELGTHVQITLSL